jgi:hypothetical protein
MERAEALAGARVHSAVLSVPPQLNAIRYAASGISGGLMRTRVVLSAAIGLLMIPCIAAAQQNSRWHDLNLEPSRIRQHVWVRTVGSHSDSLFLQLFADVALGERFIIIARADPPLPGVFGTDCVRYEYLGRQGATVILRRSRKHVVVERDDPSAIVLNSSISSDSSSELRLGSRAFALSSYCERTALVGADVQDLYVSSEQDSGAFLDPLLRTEGMIAFALGPASSLINVSFRRLR